MRLSQRRVSFCALFVALSAVSAFAETQAKHTWHADYENALAEARESGKPLLIHFHASWCGPCRQMEASVLNRPEVLREFGSQVVAVKVDSDQRPDLVSRYGVGALPSDVFVTPEQKVITRSSGGTSSSGYAARIRQIGGQYAEKHGWRVEFAKLERSRQSAGEDLDEQTPALKGFSPVAISQSSEWIKGSHDFASFYNGSKYLLSSEEELQNFEDDASRFVPRWSGLDPLTFAESRKLVDGDIRFAAFFRGEVYLFSSSENRDRFIKTPHSYADNRIDEPVGSSVAAAMR